MKSLHRSVLRGGAALVLLVVLCSATVYGASEARLGRSHAAVSRPVFVERNPEQIARGRHLARAVAQCHFCHGHDLAGKQVVDDRWVGRLYATNLTSGEGGVGTAYSDADFERAIREGVARDGRSLLLMPSDSFSGLSDEDLSAIIAYLRSVPAVDAALPARWVGPATRVALVAGLAPELIAVERIEPAAIRAPQVAAEVSPAYGAYLVRIGTCRVCHRADLRGGLHPLSLPDEPVPPALTRDGALPGWSEDAFIRTMRSGSTPDGRRLDPTYMPWPWFAGMSNTELRAIWAYLQTTT